MSYVSFEDQINNCKAYDYHALAQSSTGWAANENNYFPFMENFLSMLYMCCKELDKRFAVVNGKKIAKKARLGAMVKTGSVRRIGSSRAARYIRA